MSRNFVVWGFGIGKVNGVEKTKASNRTRVEFDEIGAAVHAITNDLSRFFSGSKDSFLEVMEIACRYSSEVHNAKPCIVKKDNKITT